MWYGPLNHRFSRSANAEILFFPNDATALAQLYSILGRAGARLPIPLSLYFPPDLTVFLWLVHLTSQLTWLIPMMFMPLAPHSYYQLAHKKFYVCTRSAVLTAAIIKFSCLFSELIIGWEKKIFVWVSFGRKLEQEKSKISWDPKEIRVESIIVCLLYSIHFKDDDGLRIFVGWHWISRQLLQESWPIFGMACIPKKYIYKKQKFKDIIAVWSQFWLD